MQPYPKNNTNNNAGDNLNVIARLRDQDIIDRNNFPNIFSTGRLVGKIPTSSTNLTSGDRVGDYSFALDGSYIYYCVSNDGAAVWRRIALGTW